MFFVNIKDVLFELLTNLSHTLFQEEKMTRKLELSTEYLTLAGKVEFAFVLIFKTPTIHDFIEWESYDRELEAIYDIYGENDDLIHDCDWKDAFGEFARQFTNGHCGLSVVKTINNIQTTSCRLDPLARY